MNQLIPETDLLDVKQGGRVSDSKTPVPGNQKEEAPHLSWSTPRNEPAAVAIDREGDKGKIARGWYVIQLFEAILCKSTDDLNVQVWALQKKGQSLVVLEDLARH